MTSGTVFHSRICVWASIRPCCPDEGVMPKSYTTREKTATTDGFVLYLATMREGSRPRTSKPLHFICEAINSVCQTISRGICAELGSTCHQRTAYLCAAFFDDRQGDYSAIFFLGRPTLSH